MPKQKSKKSLTRRFKITKTGKILRQQASRRHLKSKKSKRRLRRLTGTKEVTGFYAKKLKKVMGVKKSKVDNHKKTEKPKEKVKKEKTKKEVKTK